ncbi:hypothetical protein ES702_04371 [subsurface metagenome]
MVQLQVNDFDNAVYEAPHAVYKAASCNSLALAEWRIVADTNVLSLQYHKEGIV